MLTNVKGAIFDMDGTLIDSLLIWDVIWEELGVRFLNVNGFHPSSEDDKAVRTMTLKEAMLFIHSSYKLGNSGEEVLDEVNKIIIDFYSNDVKMKKGALNFLEYCYNNGIKMCVATATDLSLVKIAIEHCNIGKYFVDIFSCAQIGKGKDKPDIYLAALKSLGTSIDEVCIFEDSLVAIKTAKKLGIKTVGIYDKFNYGHDEMKMISDMYISDGESLEKLIIKEL